MASPVDYRAGGLAFLLGVAAVIAFVYALPATNESLRKAVLICGVIYLIFGAAMGFVRRNGGWHWGIWIAAPYWLLIGFSVLFTGMLTNFLTRDVPFLVTSVLAASLGYIGAHLLTRHNLAGHS